MAGELYERCIYEEYGESSNKAKNEMETHKKENV